MLLTLLDCFLGRCVERAQRERKEKGRREKGRKERHDARPEDCAKGVLGARCAGGVVGGLVGVRDASCGAEAVSFLLRFLLSLFFLFPGVLFG